MSSAPDHLDFAVLADVWLDPKRYRDSRLTAGLPPRTRRAAEALAHARDPSSGVLLGAGLSGPEVTRVMTVAMGGRTEIPPLPPEKEDEAHEEARRISGDLYATAVGSGDSLSWPTMVAGLVEAFWAGRVSAARTDLRALEAEDVQTWTELDRDEDPDE